MALKDLVEVEIEDWAGNSTAHISKARKADLCRRMTKVFASFTKMTAQPAPAAPAAPVAAAVPIQEQKAEPERIEPKTRAEILQEAERIVNGEREGQYGSPEDNFGRIAGLWSAYSGASLTAQDVAVMMCLMKMARIKAGGTMDCWVDLAGYAACGGEIHARN